MPIRRRGGKDETDEKEREKGKKKKLTSVLELPRLIILGHPSRSFSSRVHSKQ